MFSIIKRSFLLLVLSFFVINVHAQQKIGYVNFQDIFEKYPTTQVAKDSLANYEKRLGKQYQFKVKALENRIEFYNNTTLCATASEKETIEEKLRQKKAAVNKMPTENKEKILHKEKTLLPPIRKKIRDIIGQIAVEYGYQNIIDTLDFIYRNEENDNDITQKVRAKLGT